jgi:hypothetical protein
MNRIREIHLWADGSRHADDLHGLHAWLGRRLPDSETVVEGDVWARVRPEERAAFAARVAGGRIFELHAPLPPGGNDPLPGETAYEERRIRGETRAIGILYDGFHLSSVLRSIPGPGGGPLRALHVVLTDRLVGTFDRNDRRYHARVAVFGYPHIVSTTGVVEAPARPREYYLIRRRYRDAGMVPPEIDETLRERYLDHGDPRIAEALKGYLLQCLFYQATGEPFCPEPGCRLFNAHWQEELIFAQISSAGGLCAAHEEMLTSIAGGRGGTDAE